MRKHFARDWGLALVNKFIGFVSQIHGTGMQRKFDKGYQTGKFTKLAANNDFGSDYLWFLNGVNNPKQKLTIDILTIFTNVCDTRNNEFSNIILNIIFGR